MSLQPLASKVLLILHQRLVPHHFMVAGGPSIRHTAKNKRWKNENMEHKQKWETQFPLTWNKTEVTAQEKYTILQIVQRIQQCRHTLNIKPEPSKLLVKYKQAFFHTGGPRKVSKGKLPFKSTEKTLMILSVSMLSPNLFLKCHCKQKTKYPPA